MGQRCGWNEGGALLGGLLLGLGCAGLVRCTKDPYERGDSPLQSVTGPQKVNKIYLHWTAGSYSCDQIKNYHALVRQDGSVKRNTPYEMGLDTHTYARNSNSASISACCMGGTVFLTYPCTEQQVRGVAKEAAALMAKLGWTEADITIQKILTHGEAAANRDFPKEKAVALKAAGNSKSAASRLGLPHDNYGPSSWPDGWPGGTMERWDLDQIKKSDVLGSGGDKVRALIREEFRKLKGAPAAPKTDVCTEIASELGVQ